MPIHVLALGANFGQIFEANVDCVIVDPVEIAANLKSRKKWNKLSLSKYMGCKIILGKINGDPMGVDGKVHWVNKKVFNKIDEHNKLQILKLICI